MKAALRAADGDYLYRAFGVWRSSNGDSLIDARTIRALDDGGFIRKDGYHYVITDAGREALKRGGARDVVPAR